MSFMSIMGNMNFMGMYNYFPSFTPVYSNLNIFQGGCFNGFGYNSNIFSGGNIFTNTSNYGYSSSGTYYSWFSTPAARSIGNIFANPVQSTGIFSGSNPILSNLTTRTTSTTSNSSITQSTMFGNVFGTTTTRTTSTSSSSPTYTTNASSLKNIQWWKNLGYNPQRGKELMNYMKGHVTGFKGNCVGVVREAINKVYYGGATHYKRFGKACNIGRDFLSGDSHFKKVTGVDLSKINPMDIPEGVIIVYGPGYSTKNPECGHGEISNGNGRGYSDGITHIKNSGKQVIKELWIPV